MARLVVPLTANLADNVRLVVAALARHPRVWWFRPHPLQPGRMIEARVKADGSVVGTSLVEWETTHRIRVEVLLGQVADLTRNGLPFEPTDRLIRAVMAAEDDYHPIPQVEMHDAGRVLLRAGVPLRAEDLVSRMVP